MRSKPAQKTVLAIPCYNEENFVGDVIQFSAEPGKDWSFVRWVSGAEGTENPVTVEIASDVLVKALFEKKFAISRRLSMGDEIFSSAIRRVK